METIIRALCACVEFVLVLRGYMRLRDLNRQQTLSSIAYYAGRDPTSSVARVTAWCHSHPESKTSEKLLRHYSRVIRHLPVLMPVVSICHPEDYMTWIRRAKETLIDELCEDTYQDIDEADRTDIMLILV